MDTITHGIAGALIGKAVFGGQDMFASHPMNRGRIITWSLMFGAIFPDSDVLRDIFSHDRLLVITWHRSITHSLVLLPLWALLLAGITRAIASSRKWEAPSFTALLLVPQLLAWVYSHPEKVKRRAVWMWLVFMPAPFLIARIGQVVGAPISDRVVLSVIVIFAALFLLPALLGWGVKISHDRWNRAGFAAALIYVAFTVYAHHVALARVQKFAELEQLQVESIGALPFPPSLWHWDGLVRTERGVYELRMDLTERTASDEELLALEHRYYPDAFPNSYIEAAKRLPEVQKVLWFARFPVTRFHKEGGEAVVEIADLRFPQTRRDRPAGFTYRVRFGSDGNVLSKGWVTR